MTLEDIRKDIILELSKTDLIKDANQIGSTIGILVDILSYIKYHIDFGVRQDLKNILLPTTTDYTNAVTFAKSVLGYKISSPKGAVADIYVTGKEGEQYPIDIPKGSSFRSIDGVEFFVQSDYQLINNTPLLIKVYEGTNINKEIDPDVCNLTISDISESIVIPYNNIDIATVRVIRNGVSMRRVETIADLSDSTYFVEYFVSGNGWSEVIFSSIGYGKILESGDKIELSFNVVRGTEGNRQSGFSPKDLFNIDIVEPFSVSYGGSDPETLESIKVNAPKRYNTGNVTATKNDYESVLEELPLVAKGCAWGGEEEYPQQLGHINICCVPQDESKLFLSELEHAEVLDSINNKKLISTLKNIRQPQYIFVDFDIKIIGQLSQNNLLEKQQEIRDEIQKFYDDNLVGFRKTFFGSSLIRNLDLLFIGEDQVTIDVTFKPKMLLNGIAKEYRRSTEDFYRTYIPNALIRYKLVHQDDPTMLIDVPDDNADLADKLHNGWQIFHHRSNPLDISFSADNYPVITAESYSLEFTLPEDSTTLKNLGYYANIDGVDYNPDGLDKRIDFGTPNGVFFGNFSNMLSCIEFRTSIIDGMVSNYPDEQIFLNLDYSPYFNVIGVHNSYWKIGNVNFS